MDKTAKKNYRHVCHDIVPPLIDGNSHTLVLGSILSPKSVEAAFYYAHPQNRFWKVLAKVFDCPLPPTAKARAELALTHGIALWDVIKSCDIVGAMDSTICNAIPNDIAGLLSAHKNIKRVFVTGNKAFQLLKTYSKSVDNDIIAAAEKLPSPSPLNCATSFDDLVKAYSVLKN